jgi:hypothetical protein
MWPFNKKIETPIIKEKTRLEILQDSIGKSIIAFRVDNIQWVNETVINRYWGSRMEPEPYKAEEAHAKILSSTEIRGKIRAVKDGLLLINKKWYVLGSDPNQIYDYKIIDELLYRGE